MIRREGERQVVAGPGLGWQILKYTVILLLIVLALLALERLVLVA